jgi:hypothetical protein
VKRDLRAEVRTLLLAKPEGMTIRDLVVATGASDKSVRHSLGSMPDTYIDRWEFPRQGPLAAVFCAVVVPENCPRPTRLKRTEAEKKEYHRVYTAAWHAGKSAQKKADEIRQPSQGLTTIRGPWPTERNV